MTPALIDLVDEPNSRVPEIIRRAVQRMPVRPLQAQANDEVNPGALETVVRGAVNSASFGAFDKYASDPLQRRISEVGRKNHPIADVVGQVVGSTLPVAGASSAVRASVPVLATAGKTLLGTVGKRAAREALAGTVYGLANQAVAGEGSLIDQAGEVGKEAAVWGALGAAVPVVGRGLKAVRGFGSRAKYLANPVGTPEIVLRDTPGVVEPWIKLPEIVKADRERVVGRLESILAGIDDVSDKTIFDALNNPKAKLSGKALELRQWYDNTLSEINKRRVARGDEPIRRIKGYATHIRDFVESSGDVPGLASGSGDGVAKKIGKFPFQDRIGDDGYLRSATAASRAYAEAAIRDMGYRGAFLESARAIESIPVKAGAKARPLLKQGIDGQHYLDFSDPSFITKRGYAESFLKRQLGMPTTGEKAIESIFNITPKTQRKAAQAVTLVFYRSLIGGALDTATKNLTQTINTVSEFGLTPTLRGYGKLMTKAGRATARREHLLTDYEPLLQAGESLNLGKSFFKKFDDHVLSSPMKLAEFVNRGVTFHAAMDQAVRQGMSAEMAHQFARDSVRKLQYAYGKANISPFLQGTITRPLYQFGSYPSKQLELMYGWATRSISDRAKLLRYFGTTGALIAGGTIAGVDLSTIFPNPLKFVDPDSDRGVAVPFADGRRVTLDVGKFVTSSPMPSGLPPIVTAPSNIGQSLARGDYGRAGRRAVQTLVPGGRYAQKVYDVVRDTKAGKYAGDKAGVPPQVAKLLGVAPASREESYDKGRRVNELQGEYANARTAIINAILDKDSTKAEALFNDFAAKYPDLSGYLGQSLTPTSLRNALMDRQGVEKPQSRKKALIEFELWGDK